jgi:hypothetical protein
VQLFGGCTAHGLQLSIIDSTCSLKVPGQQQCIEERVRQVTFTGNPKALLEYAVHVVYTEPLHSVDVTASKAARSFVYEQQPLHTTLHLGHWPGEWKQLRWLISLHQTTWAKTSAGTAAEHMQLFASTPAELSCSSRTAHSCYTRRNSNDCCCPTLQQATSHMPLMAEAAAQHHQQQTTTVPHALHTDHLICSSTHICSSCACTKHYHTYYIGPQYNAATETHVMIILCTHHPNIVD